MSNFRAIDRKTGYLLPPSVDEWLPEKHLARFIVDVIDGLDLGRMSRAYRAGSGCLDRFPRTISGVLPGLLSLPHRGWDEGRAQPDRRSNPYAARKLSCRRRDWRRFEVSLVRGASVKARMRALSIVEVEIAAQRRASFRDRVVGFEIYLLVFYGFPEPLDENIVAPGAPAVHADGDPVREQDAGERLAGELTALVGVENFRFAMFADSLLQRLDAKAGLHRDRHTM